MDKEIVDVVDEDGTVIRQELKSAAHKNGSLHKTVIGYLRYGTDWAFARQAADKQDAGRLVAAVGGHVTTGESNVEALMRESKEEIGADTVKYRYIGDKIFRRKVRDRDENHLFIIYEISTDDPIMFNEETVSVERFSDDDLRRSLQERPQEFGDGLYFVFESFYLDYLPGDYQRRWS